MPASISIPGFTRAVGNRAVHCRLLPRPTSLAQSSQILQLLRKRYGPVEVFRNLRYDRIPAPAVLVVFRSDEAAYKILRDSPVRFRMRDGFILDDDAEDGDGDGDGERIGRHRDDGGERMFPPPPPEDPTLTLLGKTTSQPQPPQIHPSVPEGAVVEYEMVVNPSTANHRDQIDSSAMHGRYQVDTKPAAQQDLAWRVPFPGLSDLNVDQKVKPWRIVSRERAYLEKEMRPLRDVWNEGAQDTTSSREPPREGHAGGTVDK